MKWGTCWICLKSMGELISTLILGLELHRLKGLEREREETSSNGVHDVKPLGPRSALFITFMVRVN